MKNKSVIIFDFFGVICSEISPLWLNCYLESDKAKEVKDAIVGQADRGEVSEKEMLQLLSLETGIEPNQILKEWMSLAHINQEFFPVLKRLKDNYKLALLSNAPAEFLHRILEKHDLYKYFDVMVISSEEKCTKPDERIYRKLIDRLGEPSANCIMIDDNPANIAGAERVGIDGWIYTDFKEFTRSLDIWL